MDNGEIIMAYGVTVIQRPPSPWHALLGGLGTGVGQGVEDYFNKKKKQNEFSTQLMQGVLTGQIDPRLLSTKEGQEWLKKMGVYDDPGVNQILRTATKMTGPLTDRMDLHDYYEIKSREAEKEKAHESLQKIQEELAVFTEKERIKRELANIAKLSPDDAGNLIDQFNALAQARGMSIEDVSINPEGKVSFNIRTPLEFADIQYDRQMKEQQRIKSESEKLLNKYYQKKDKAMNFVMNITDKVSKIVHNPLSEDVSGVMQGIYAFLDKDIPSGLESTIKKSNPEVRAKLLLQIAQKAINEHNRELVSLGVQAGLSPAEIYQAPQITYEEIVRGSIGPLKLKIENYKDESRKPSIDTTPRKTEDKLQNVVKKLNEIMEETGATPSELYTQIEAIKDRFMAENGLTPKEYDALKDILFGVK